MAIQERVDPSLEAVAMRRRSGRTRVGARARRILAWLAPLTPLEHAHPLWLRPDRRLIDRRARGTQFRDGLALSIIAVHDLGPGEVGSALGTIAIDNEIRSSAQSVRGRGSNQNALSSSRTPRAQIQSVRIGGCMRIKTASAECL